MYLLSTVLVIHYVNMRVSFCVSSITKLCKLKCNAHKKERKIGTYEM